MTQHAHHTNRLAGETSPYLLQHKNNPVDWYAWGDEAFEKARRENKPLLISIGYSACHWCHVMERESFENQEIARIMNDMLVPVKVDREERPDVDAIYMNACIAMSGQGGWPLNAFVTPDLKPFFVGTYFPPDGRWGRPGFREVLERIREMWLTEGEQIKQQAVLLQKQLEQFMETARRGSLDPRVWDRLVNEAATSFDIRFGGFGGAPKFPPDQRVAALLVADHAMDSRAAREMATKTLDKMAYGGMYDQLGGGFARYSVDEHWLIPHFEKMLYNQALLVPVYVDAFLITGKPLYERTTRETLDWVLRDLSAPEGVFYSALDADSEGEEGKFYVWTPGEIETVLGRDDAALFVEYYGITKHGNFEHGTSALHIEMPPDEFAGKHGMTEEAWLLRLDGMKRRMLEVRTARVSPGLDDKALTSWNGLMITAMCRGFQLTGEEKYLSAARAAADFILEKQRRGSTLLRCYCKGQSRISGVLDDYAFFIGGLIDLYESCFEMKYLTASAELAETMVASFYDEAEGGFFFTSGEDASLISRTKDVRDGALPAGSSVAVAGLLRLSAFCGREDFRNVAVNSIEAVGARVNQAPGAFGSLLLASNYAGAETPQIVAAGDPNTAAVKEIMREVYTTYLPARIIAFAAPGSELPLLKGKSSETAAAYVCENYACKAPVHSADELKKQLASRRTQKPDSNARMPM